MVPDGIEEKEILVLWSNHAEVSVFRVVQRSNVPALVLEYSY